MEDYKDRQKKLEETKKLREIQHPDDEEVIAKIDKHIAQLKEELMVYTTITIEDEPIEELAFKQAIEEFETWRQENDKIEDEDYCDNIYAFEVRLKNKSYVYCDFGDRNYWKYTFEICKV